MAPPREDFGLHYIAGNDADQDLAAYEQLLFPPVTPSFVADLGLDGGDYVHRFLGYYETADRSPDLVSEVTATFD